MKYIFLHIPKTAGTSFGWALKANGSQSVFEENRYDFANRWETLSSQQKEEVKYIVGHLYYGVHNQIDEPCKYLSLLRDPVERVVSHYHYVLNDSANPQHEVAKGLTLEQYVQTSTVVQNHQTKVFCGNEEKADLQTAYENVESSFELVGTTENYAAFLAKLQLDLSLQQAPTLNANTGSYDKTITEKERQTILAYNQLDTELYNWVKQRFPL